VADVISQIQDGVTEAIRRHDQQGTVGRINPKFPEDDWKDLVQKIDFDIAITASDRRLERVEEVYRCIFLRPAGNYQNPTRMR
jgi:hypothetical protein